MGRNLQPPHEIIPYHSCLATYTANMDFAALMNQAISGSKPKSSSEPEPSKKYMKRAEVEEERRQKYLAEQRALEAEKEAKLKQKRKREEEEAEAKQAREEKRRKLAEESRRRREEQEAEEERARRKRLGLPELIKETSEEVDADDIKDEELVEKLREMGQPITLFGESHKQRLRRFRKLGIVEIVKAAQERRYVDANDGYLRLSIGKAAWPIGVTMVGIHERSAREKLHESDKGHVMGDEVTRKFLQSIKRCLSFAQVRWPPEDIRQLMG